MDWPYRQRLHELTQEELKDAKFIRGHFSYDGTLNKLKSKPYTIIFLRDPVTRFISHFEHLKREEGDPPGLHDKIKSLSLDEFLLKPELTSLIANMGARLLCGFEPDQTWDTPDINKGRERLAAFDFVGLTERYQESINLFTSVFNLPDVKYLHYENQSPNISERTKIGIQTLNRISAINQVDIDLYNYGKQIFDSRNAERRINHEPPKKEPLTRFDFDFSSVDPGQGWYIGECHPKFGIARWSGPELISYIRIPALFKQDYSIKISVINAVDPEVLDGFHVEINGIDIPLTKCHTDLSEMLIFEGKIPQSNLAHGSGENLLVFKVQKTVRPSEINGNNPDNRPLGLCYNSLSIAPVIQ